MDSGLLGQLQRVSFEDLGFMIAVSVVYEISVVVGGGGGPPPGPPPSGPVFPPAGAAA
jgi:hypothetical protein